MIYAPLISWWLLLQAFGLIGLPLAFRLFGNLPDRGYAFARPLGLLLTGYLLWLGGSLGFWRNGVGGSLFAMLAVASAGGWLYLKRRDTQISVLGWLRAHTAYWLSVESLFALTLIGWTIYKSFNPNLETAGGEKWMEIAFVNSTLRSDSFPPQDPWLSGFGISYYYFGYVLMSIVTRLTGLSASVAFNLFIPTLFALTLTGAFSITYNMVANRANVLGGDGRHARTAIGFGLLGAIFVGVLGNLEGALEVLHSRGLLQARFWRWLDIIDINGPPIGNSWVPTRFIWWWRASRVIHDCSFQGILTGDCNPPHGNWEVIDEFPFFSFLLGDVHPHVLALPFVLLAIGLALNLLLNRSQDKTPLPGNPNPPLEIADIQPPLRARISGLCTSTFGGWAPFIIYALCLGALGFLNTWDFPIYLFVVTLAFAVWRATIGSRAWVSEAIAVGFGLGVVGGLAYLPFYLGFQSQAGGILPNLFNPTKLQQFLVFFGPFLFVVISYLSAISRSKLGLGWRRRLPFVLASILVGPVLALLALSAALAISTSARAWVEGLLRDPSLLAMVGDASLSSLALMAVRIRLGNPWTALFLGGLLAWVLLFWPSTEIRRHPVTARLSPNSGPQALVTSQLLLSDMFALILIGVGVLLPLAVEFVYLRDLFGTRMNTVFKFYFQAWVLLALASAYGVSVVSEKLRGVGGAAWRLILVLLVLGGLIYPALAIPNKTGNFSAKPVLDGMAWMAAAHPDDYAAIRWLQANATNGAVILEAPGESYRYLGRVSALTGLPTVLGWDFHEYQWRGTYDEPARRKPDIDVLYNSVDPAQALTLLDKYDITYVYVGPLERDRYNPDGLAKFGRLMDLAYQQGEVTIFQRSGSIAAQ